MYPKQYCLDIPKVHKVPTPIVISFLFFNSYTSIEGENQPARQQCSAFPVFSTEYFHMGWCSVSELSVCSLYSLSWCVYVVYSFVLLAFPGIIALQKTKDVRYQMYSKSVSTVKLPQHDFSITMLSFQLLS